MRGLIHRGLLGPDGRPMLRDVAAHKAFRARELAESERVVWRFPRLDGIEFREVPLKDVVAHVENDSHHPVSLEVGRLMKAYVERFRTDLLRLARHYNRDGVPHMGITRDPPRWPVEHVAQHLAAAFIQEKLIDATEEAPLLHPGEPE